jgi:hypothetical protein
MRVLLTSAVAAVLGVLSAPAVLADSGSVRRDATAGELTVSDEGLAKLGLRIVHSGMEELDILTALADIKPDDYGENIMGYCKAVLEVGAVLEAKAKGRFKTAVVIRPRR